MSQPRRQPTMRDVARVAGVSQRTVSNVVSNYRHVTPETRAKVRAAIAELGYRPNVAAQRLREGRTGIIALAVPSLTWPYFSDIAHLIQVAAQRAGATLMVVETEGNAAFERKVLQGFRTNLIDGLILSPIELSAAELDAMDLGIPVVLLGERIKEVGMLHLSMDNVQGAREMAAHVHDMGARSFVLLGSTHTMMTSSAGALRLRGFTEELASRGVPPTAWREISVSPWTQEGGYEVMLAELATGPRPDAVIGMNDLLAFGTLRACAELGISVPGDMLVSGWDDISLGRYSVPTITTVSPDKAAIAQRAVDGLLGQVEAGAQHATDVTVAHSLVIRESTMVAGSDQVPQ